MLQRHRTSIYLSFIEEEEKKEFVCKGKSFEDF